MDPRKVTQNKQTKQILLLAKLPKQYTPTYLLDLDMSLKTVKLFILIFLWILL